LLVTKRGIREASPSFPGGLESFTLYALRLVGGSAAARRRVSLLSKVLSKMVDLSSYIRDIPDYPKPGILFRDITPMLADPVAIRTAVERMAEPFVNEKVDIVAAAEARGFIFAAPLAIQLGAGFVPIRKPGKLPFDLHSFAYKLEYGTDELQVHVDGVKPGQRVLVVDDLLATGGTVEACCRLLEKSKAEIIGCTFLIHLVQLGGEERLRPYRVHSVLRYDQDDHEAELSL